MNDQHIISLFWSRSEYALQEISEKYGGLCMKIAYNILNNTQDAEECTNDTYLALWNQIPPTKPSSLSAYTAKICRNLALSKREFLSAKKRNSNMDIAIEEIEQFLPAASDTEGILEGKMLEETVKAFLASLPAGKRRVFIRRYFFFDTIPAISKQLGMKESTVKSILSRDGKKLQHYLQREGYGMLQDKNSKGKTHPDSREEEDYDSKTPN